MFHALTWPEFKKNILILKDWIHKKRIFYKELGFRGGSDEKLRRMWLELGIVVVYLPPLMGQDNDITMMVEIKLKKECCR